jgi:hypothetical protein
MFSTHVGKIGRLSQSIRDELGRRIENGEPGKELVKWLNRQPSVREILKGKFGGRLVTEQNLSEWKQGGHQEWLRHQEARCFVEHLHEKAGQLTSYNEDDEWYTEVDTSEDLAVVLGAELARLTEILLKKSDDPQEQLRWVVKALHESNKMRRNNHRAARLKRDQLLWRRQEEERDKYAEGAELRKVKHDLLAPIRAQMLANGFAEAMGGGENGRKVAEFIAEVQNDLPSGTLSGKNPPASGRSNPTESNLIQPNPTNFTNGPDAKKP